MYYTISVMKIFVIVTKDTYLLHTDEFHKMKTNEYHSIILFFRCVWEGYAHRFWIYLFYVCAQEKVDGTSILDIFNFICPREEKLDGLIFFFHPSVCDLFSNTYGGYREGCMFSLCKEDVIVKKKKEILTNMKIKY